MTEEISPTVSPRDRDEKLDYATITDDQKVAVKECVKILKELQLYAAADEILLRIGIEKQPEYDVRESDVWNFLREEGVGPNIQGFTLDNGMRYPIVSVFADIRKLEEVFLKYKQKNKKFWQ